MFLEYLVETVQVAIWVFHHPVATLVLAATVVGSILTYWAIPEETVAWLAFSAVMVVGGLLAWWLDTLAHQAMAALKSKLTLDRPSLGDDDPFGDRHRESESPIRV